MGWWDGCAEKICTGCGKEVTLDDVVVFHECQAKGRVAFCPECFPEKWRLWMSVPSRDIYDQELADVMQERLIRQRIRDGVQGDGTFSEQEYADLVVREVDRARRAYERQMRGE